MVQSLVQLRPSSLGLFPEQPTPRHYDHLIRVLRLHQYSLLRHEHREPATENSPEHNSEKNITPVLHDS